MVDLFTHKDCLILNNSNPPEATISAKNKYSVIAFPHESIEETIKLLQKLDSTHPHAQKLVSSSKLTVEDLTKIYSSEAEHIQICDLNSKNILDQITQALEQYQKYAPITSSENNAEGTTIAKSPSQKRTVTIKNQVEALHKALLAVHSSQSVAEVETLLHSALSKSLDLSWVRVFLHASEHLDEQLERIQGQALFKSTLMLGSRNLGRIVFARAHTKAFSKSEEEALNLITESVALAL
ncbi:MAG: hypothetical protein KDD38_04740, partial [Bdellovibrionales bacterium]|nr:hypothetical protein [Bdellovibrionales bacterium]